MHRDRLQTRIMEFFAKYTTYQIADIMWEANLNEKTVKQLVSMDWDDFEDYMLANYNRWKSRED